MEKVFLAFCFFVLILDLIFLFSIIYKYINRIKMNFKIYFINTIFNTVFLPVSLTGFICSGLYLIISKSIGLLPTTTLFLIFFTNRILDSFILVSTDSILIKNSLLNFSTVSKVEYRKIISKEKYLLIIYTNNKVLNMIISKKNKTLLNSLFNSYNIPITN
jgi:hypothetical protein